MSEAGSQLSLSRLVLLFFLILCIQCQLGVAMGQSSKGRETTPAQSPSPSPTPTATAAQVPSLTEIATGLDNLQRIIEDIKRRLAHDSVIVDIDARTKSLTPELDARSVQADEVLTSLPSLPDIEDLDNEWRELALKIEGTQKTLLTSAKSLNNDLSILDLERTKWSAVLSQIQSDSTLAELQGRLNTALNDIDTTRTMAQDRLRQIVNLQTRLSTNAQLVKSVEDRIDVEKAQIQRGLFQADSGPLWNFSSRARTDQALQRVLQRHATRDWIRLREFLAVNRASLVLALMIGLIVLILGFKMRRNLPLWVEAQLVNQAHVEVFRRPYTLASFAVLLSLYPLLPTAPSSVRGLLALLLVVPLIRMSSPLISGAERKLLNALIITMLVFQAVKMAGFSVTLKRYLLALLALAAIAVFGFLSQKVRAHRDQLRRVFVLAVRLAIILLTLSFLANLFGYFALSQVLGDAILFGAYYAVMLYSTGRTLLILLATLLKTETASRSAVLRNHSETIMRWSAVLLSVVAFLIWFFSLLRLFTIRDAFVDGVRSLLEKPIVSGQSSFTAGNVLSFIVVALVGIIIATIIKVVLREDVLKRLPVRHGVPFALSMLTYYVILLLVFITALLAAGVELSKFTLLTGAFGIGVGFGLQNTINNFASGLILLFERPIRERDILEVDGAFGEVTRIGMRSTSIRTAEEAEVIVPNSTLVAGKVINWTRLGRRRPVELPVRVAYGTDPEEVIQVLTRVATEHADVLAEPAPTAFLQKFGEKALEFTLVFWVGRYHLDRRVLSEVAISVSHAFQESGIRMSVSEKDQAQSEGDRPLNRLV